MSSGYDSMFESKQFCFGWPMHSDTQHFTDGYHTKEMITIWKDYDAFSFPTLQDFHIFPLRPKHGYVSQSYFFNQRLIYSIKNKPIQKANLILYLIGGKRPVHVLKITKKGNTISYLSRGDFFMIARRYRCKFRSSFSWVY